MFHIATTARFVAIVVASFMSAIASADNLLLNPGAEKGKGNNPSIWDRAYIEAKGLVMERSTTAPKSGEASLMIANEHEYDQPVANNWMQDLQKVPNGAVLRVAAEIRTEDADSANVCLQCWDATGAKMLAFGSTPVIRGDQEWIRVTSGPMIVPPETAQVIVRAALMGKGKVWFDDLEVIAERNSAGLATSEQSKAKGSEPIARSVPEPSLLEILPGRLIETVPIVQDCMILSYIPEWQHGELDNIAVADNDGGVRTLFAWRPLSKEAIGGANRHFYLAVYSRKTTEGGKWASEDKQADAREILVCPIADKWPESISWQNQPKIDESAKPVSAPFEASDGWKVFDVTPLIRNKTSANKFGVMMKFEAEDKSSEKGLAWSGYELVSREGLGEWEGRHAKLLVVEAAEASNDTAAKK